MIAADFSKVEIATVPFGHCVIDGFFEPNFFRALADSYPTCPPASGPTGFTIHRGDPQFDRIISENDAWQRFYTYCNSPAFLEGCVTMFAKEIAESCYLKAVDLSFVDYIETRKDKELRSLSQPEHDAVKMFVRFDFMQGMNSYVREPHLDHRRRLVNMLVYFDSPGPDTFSGGELLLHDPSGEVVECVLPKANRAVFFACSEKSWHSVHAVSNCHNPRRFVQVALSGCHDLWPTAQLPPVGVIQKGQRWLSRLAHT